MRPDAVGGNSKGDDSDYEPDFSPKLVEKEQMKWPKHPLTKGIQKNHGKVDAAMVAFSALGWNKHLSVATVRSNLKATMELDTKLKDCEHTELIERNLEHKRVWILVQGLQRDIKDYLTCETEEKLLNLREPLLELDTNLSKVGKPLVGRLRVIMYHSIFVHTGKEKSLSEALDSLGLDASKCAIKMAIGIALTDDPDCGVLPFPLWAETATERMAKSFLRTLDLGITSRPAEMQKALVFFRAYREVVAA